MVYVYLLLIVLVIYLLYKYLTGNYRYWKDLGIPYEEPTFLFGSIKENVFGRKQYDILLSEIYRKHDAPYVGFFKFTQPHLLIRDHELAGDILMRDFSYFEANDTDFTDQLLRMHPFVLIGDTWKRSRSRLTQCLTLSKLKSAVPLIQDVADKFVDYVGNFHGPINVGKLCTRFMIQNAINLLFNLDANCFKLDDSSIYLDINKKVFYPSATTTFRQMTLVLFPILQKVFELRFVPQDVEDFIKDVMRSNIRNKKDTDKECIVDMLLKKNALDGDDNLDDLISITSGLYVDMTEANAVIMGYLMYRLATNLDVQDKVRKEIEDTKAKFNGTLTYDALKELKYFDCVMNETLRTHPSAFLLRKKCTRDYKLPPLNENGSKNETIVLKAGTSIFIPGYSFHFDEKFFPEPERFNPDRFSDDNKHLIRKFSYLPFGDGPRRCVGAELVKLQTKIAMTAVLTNYAIRFNNKTKEPLVVEPNRLFFMPVKDGIWLEFHKIIN